MSSSGGKTWHLNPLPAHPNGLRFTVFDEKGDMLATNEYFSVGGGFVVRAPSCRALGGSSAEGETGEQGDPDG
jgi:hypothetical protein